MTNAKADFIFDAKSLTYYMYVNVYFKHSTLQYKAQITKEEYELCKKEEEKNDQ